MDRIDEFNKKLAQLDRSDPIQVQAMIDFIDKWTNDEAPNLIFKKLLITARINLLLNQWENLLDPRYLALSMQAILDYLKTFSVTKDIINAIENVFDNWLAIYEGSKDREALNFAIFWGNLYYKKAFKTDFLYLTNLLSLAGSLITRYDLQKNNEDLDSTIELLEEAISLTTDRTAELGELFRMLAQSLEERFRNSSSSQDLFRCIASYEEAIDLPIENISDKADVLYNLGLMLHTKYQLFGDDQDLSTSITFLSKSLDLIELSGPVASSVISCLANVIFNRFALTGNENDLNTSIDLIEQALAVAGEDSQDRPRLISDLAAYLGQRYIRNGDIKDLILWKELARIALETSQDNTEIKSVIVLNLAQAMETSYILTGDLRELTDWVDLCQASIDASGSVIYKYEKLISLSSALLERYLRFGNNDDLEASISIGEKVIAEIHPKSPARGLSLCNLAASISYRYNKNANLADLLRWIDLAKESLEEPISNPISKMKKLGVFAASLRCKFIRFGIDQDIDESIKMFRESLSLTKEDSIFRPNVLSDLALALGDRFVAKGDRSDLDERIQLLEYALKQCTNSHPKRPFILTNLALALTTRYSLDGDKQDLVRSINLNELALSLTEPDSVVKIDILNNLGVAQLLLFTITGDLAALSKCIKVLEEGLEKVTQLSEKKPLMFCNLSVAYGELYDRLGDENDLDKTILFIEEAIELTNSESVNYSQLLNNLSKALGNYYLVYKDIEILNKCIDLLHNAIEKADTYSPNQVMYQTNLASFLTERYSLRNSKEDIIEAYTLLISALGLLPEKSVYKSTVYNSISNAYWESFLLTGDEESIHFAINFLQDSANLLVNGHPDKHKSLNSLASTYFAINDYQSALEAYEGMAENLEILRSASPNRRDRGKLISDNSKGFANLVFCCLKLNQPEKALRYAEAAKSRALVDALHNQVTDISNLATHDDSLKANLEELQNLQHEINWLLRQLDAGDQILGLIDPNASRLRRPPDEINADLKDKRAKEQELWEILEKHAPVFAMTVSAPPFHLQDALALADEENAALISYYQHSQGWVAFVVCKSKFFIAELQGVEKLLEHYQSAFSNLHSPFGKKLLSSVLEEAWQVLIQPLQKWLPAEGTNLVIAPFAGLHHLPFAAFTNPTDGSYLVDRYHLKAATSLGTLKAMRTQAQIGAEGHANAHAMTVVGYADDPSSPSYLPAVEDEVNAISNLFHMPHLLIGQAAMIENVLTQAPGSQSLHFACHGMFDPKQPHHSGLMLEDGWLTVRDILTRMNLSGTDMVVMSSCLSGLSRISQGEELTGLLTAFISARAKSVVGSLWSVDDRSTAELMVRFYELISKGWERSAALREAKLFIRKQPQWQHPYYWSPFFLTGVG